MMAVQRALTLLCALATLALPISSMAFQDSLDLPAKKSALASRSLLNGIAKAGDRLVTVGQRGHILYSDDAGKNWTQSSSVPVSSDLTSVYFASPRMGWAVGHDGVVLTTRDSGSTWVKQLDGRMMAKIIKDYYAANSPRDIPIGSQTLAAFQADINRLVDEGADKPLLDVWFQSETTGYAVGMFNLIIRTTDGGNTWIPWFEHTDNPNRLHLYAIRSIGDDVYLAGEQGMVLRLDKVALRFRDISVDYKGTLFGIAGTKDSILAFGLRGNVFLSEDRGAHWKKIETGLTVAITGAATTADGRIALVSQSGHVLLSEDGSKTFKRVQVASTPASAAVSVVPQELVTVGARGVNIYPIKN